MSGAIFVARNKFMAYKGIILILPVTELRIVCLDFTFPTELIKRMHTKSDITLFNKSNGLFNIDISYSSSSVQNRTSFEKMPYCASCGEITQ
jgi:hypothetical protein